MTAHFSRNILILSLSHFLNPISLTHSVCVPRTLSHSREAYRLHTFVRYLINQTRAKTQNNTIGTSITNRAARRVVSALVIIAGDAEQVQEIPHARMIHHKLTVASHRWTAGKNTLIIRAESKLPLVHGVFSPRERVIAHAELVLELGHRPVKAQKSQPHETRSRANTPPLA